MASRFPGPQITDFDIIRVIGKGCAGKVLMCKYQPTGKLYAIKALHKYHVLAHRELSHTLTEQAILKRMTSQIKNPFVVQLSWSFQDTDNLFLALDFHSGGDLATQLARWGRLGVDRTRFYIAEIIEGLQGLHDAGIIYRDLKPENILLANDGHIILTDFGLSKAFQRAAKPTDKLSLASSASLPQWLRDSGRSQASLMHSTSTFQSDWAESTSTFCGTAEYLAPEVLLGHAYSYPVDLWSLGTMMYEMLIGVTPFYNEDHSIMYNRVIKESLNLTKRDSLDADTKALLRGLLRKEPEFRMSIKRAKRAKYFEAIDWQLIYNKRYIPPFIPEVAADNPQDTQNFDDIFVQMDIGLVDPAETAQIEAKAAASGKPFDSAFDESGRDVFASYSYTAVVEADVKETEDELEETPAVASEEGSEVIEGKVSGLETDESFRNDTSQPSFRNEVHKQSFRKFIQAPEAQRAAASISSTFDDKFEETATHEDNATQITQQNEVIDDIGAQHHQLTSPGGSTEQSVDSRARVDSTDQGYDTGITSASATDDNLVGKAAATSLHGRRTSSGLDPVFEKWESLEELEEIANQRAPYAGISKSGDGRPVEANEPHSNQPTPLEVVLACASNVRSRISEEGEDWHLIDIAQEQAANGMAANARRRVMAGTSLLSQGIIDRYRLQVKPLSRATSRPTTPLKGNSRATLRRGLSLLTPAKWGDAATTGSQRGSSADLGLTSPSESSIGQSGTSLPDSREQVCNTSQTDFDGKKTRMPYLTMRFSSQPGSPPPMFRLKRGKRPIDIVPGSNPTDPTAFPQFPKVQTPGSATTLPVETGSLRLDGLSRQPATLRDCSEMEFSKANNADAVDKSVSARLKQKRIRFDPTRLSLLQIRTEKK